MMFSLLQPLLSWAAVPTDDIRDIHGPIHITPLWIKGVSILGGLLLLWICWRLVRAWRNRRRVVVERLPHEIALERLREALQWLKPGNSREFSIKVSTVIRDYIEARFAVRAAHRTTEEFLHDLLRDANSPMLSHSGALNDFLFHCDLAKFARWELSVEDMQSMHGSAERFVEETRPKPEAAK